MSPKLHTIPKLAALSSSSPSPTLMTDIIWPWGNLVTVWRFEAYLFLSPIFVCLSHFCTDQKPDVASTQPSWPCLTRVPGAAYLFQERERSHIDRQTQTHRGIDVQTDADLQTHTQTDTHTEMDTDMYWWTHTETNRHRHTDTYREKYRHTHRKQRHPEREIIQAPEVKHREGNLNTELCFLPLSASSSPSGHSFQGLLCPRPQLAPWNSTSFPIIQIEQKMCVSFL